VADVTSFYVANGHGNAIDSPSKDEMQKLLGDIDASDEERAAWLSTETGFSLEWNGDGRLVFTAEEGPPRHLRGSSRHRALDLRIALAAGNLTEVERCAWQPGIGYRRDGCARGAVPFSVLCRPHHFESIKKRPSPFHD
jgi:hypothetical protein